jgi:peptidoglycan/LPS O-acetylase OafA/YrhL
VHDGIFTVPHPDQMSRWEWLGNLTLTESWRHTVFGGEATHLLPNTWTLCYEEQFYVVAALILLFASRRIFTAAIVVTSLIFVGKTVAWSLGWDVKGSLLDGGWFLIAAGILLYYRVNFATPRQIHLIHAVLLIGIMASVLHPSRLLEFYPNHDTERFIAYSFTLLASLLYPYDHKVRGAKWLRPFWIVGGFSYSVYLCHPLIAKGISYAMYRAGWQSNSVTLFAVLPLVMVLSIAVALVYHRLIERHFIPQNSSADAPQSTRPPSVALAPAAS